MSNDNSKTIRTTLAGERFTRLTVVSLDKEVGNGGRRYWVCLCDCGATTKVTTSKLRAGSTKSCGCYAADSLRNIRLRHGMVKSPEFKAWSEMRQRCGNKNNHNYYNYGGRGITVCERWSSFESFIVDMGYKPSCEHSLERVDNNRGYSPDNCIWADKTTQARNRRTNLVFTLGGRTSCLSEWCELLSLDSSVVYQRIRKLKWSFEKAITTPTRRAGEKNDKRTTP